jgi:hypothetical protein
MSGLPYQPGPRPWLLVRPETKRQIGPEMTLRER